MWLTTDLQSDNATSPFDGIADGQAPALISHPQCRLRALPNLLVLAARPGCPSPVSGDKKVKLRVRTILRDIRLPIWSSSPGPSGDTPATPLPRGPGVWVFLLGAVWRCHLLHRKREVDMGGGGVIGAFCHDAGEFGFPRLCVGWTAGVRSMPSSITVPEPFVCRWALVPSTPPIAICEQSILWLSSLVLLLLDCIAWELTSKLAHCRDRDLLLHSCTNPFFPSTTEW